MKQASRFARKTGSEMKEETKQSDVEATMTWGSPVEDAPRPILCAAAAAAAAAAVDIGVRSGIGAIQRLPCYCCYDCLLRETSLAQTRP